MTIHQLSIQEVEYVAHALARELMNFTEPIPPFHTRYPGKLESCLEQPFQTFNGQDLYPTFHDKAAALFYLIIKNHPFENGNKRMAVMALLVFLYTNNRWLNVSPLELYRFAHTISKSKASPLGRKRAVNKIRKFITDNIEAK